jgi:hypothetical protein
MLINNQPISNIIESNGGAKTGKMAGAAAARGVAAIAAKWHQKQKIISNGISENNNNGMA